MHTQRRRLASLSMTTHDENRALAGSSFACCCCCCDDEPKRALVKLPAAAPSSGKSSGAAGGVPGTLRPAAAAMRLPLPLAVREGSESSMLEMALERAAGSKPLGRLWMNWGGSQVSVRRGTERLSAATSSPRIGLERKGREGHQYLARFESNRVSSTHRPWRTAREARTDTERARCRG